MQLEFGFLLGPPEGRYLIREAPEAPAEWVITLTTATAPTRRGPGRRGRRAEGQPEPSPTPIARATIARAEPFADESAAERWLAGMRRDRKGLRREVERAVEVLNRMLRAHRAAVADPYVREVRGAGALARRVGYAEGRAVAAGRIETLVEVPPDERRERRSERMRPQERLAAALGGRSRTLACEELTLRARLDVDSDSGREAALQARIALETLLVELASDASLARDRAALEADREQLALASNVALERDLDDHGLEAVRGAVERMERVLARRRATGV